MLKTIPSNYENTEIQSENSDVVSSNVAIDKLFAMQQKHSLKLRSSTYKDRVALLDRF